MPHSNERSQRVLPVRLTNEAVQPARQLGDRDPTVGVAREQLSDDRRLMRDDLVTRLGVVALADIAVAERRGVRA